MQFQCNSEIIKYVAIESCTLFGGLYSDIMKDAFALTSCSNYDSKNNLFLFEACKKKNSFILNWLNVFLDSKTWLCF